MIEESRELYQAICEKMPVAALVLNTDGIPVYFSSNFSRIVGVDRHDSSAVRAILEQLDGVGAGGGQEITVAGDGVHPRFFHAETKPLSLQEDHILVFLRDTTSERSELGRLEREKKKSELKLQLSHERFRYILKHDPSAIAVLDRNMDYIYVSDRFLKDYRVSEKDVIGRNHYEVFPEIPSRWKDIHRQVLEGGIVRSMEDYFFRPDGSVDYNRWECRPWFEQDGEIGGIIMYTEVITERKQAEIALLKSETQLRHLMDSTVEAIVGLDTDGNCIFINRSGLELLGYDNASELIGRNMHDFCHHSDPDGNPLAAADCPVVGALRDGLSLKSDDMVYWRKDGTSFPVSCRMQPYVVESVAAGGVLTFLDVTEQINASAEKKRLEEQLQQSQKMEAIGTLAGGIAHDFNNILGAIIGYGELIELFGKDDWNEVEEKVGLMLRAAYRARELVGQILTFSRREEGDFTAISCIQVVEDILMLLRASLPAGITIETRFATTDDVIFGNITQLQRVLLNICTNAVQAMPPQGGSISLVLGQVDSVATDKWVVMSVPDNGPWLFFDVRDNGCGFDAALTERIFDPYFTTKKVGEGTGMGLAIVYGIVKMHGGCIAVQSEAGKGSVFRVYLPRVAAGQAELEPADEETIVAGSATILLVDDEVDLLQSQKQFLQRLGYSVVTAGGGKEALELFKKRSDTFDIVITDQTMPGLNGTDLAEKIHFIRPELPVLLCTGNIEMVAPEQLERADIAKIVKKPVSLKVLAGRIGELVKKGA